MVNARGVVVRGIAYGGMVLAHAGWAVAAPVAVQSVTAVAILLVAVLAVDKQHRVAAMKAITPTLLAVLTGARRPRSKK